MYLVKNENPQHVFQIVSDYNGNYPVKISELKNVVQFDNELTAKQYVSDILSYDNPEIISLEKFQATRFTQEETQVIDSEGLSITMPYSLEEVINTFHESDLLT